MVARRDFAGGAAATTLSADINSTATSISIASASGWPSGTNGEFYIAIDRGHAGEEKCLVLSRSGTTLTLASAAKRGVDGTTASSHTAGVTVEHVGAAADLDEANAFVSAPGASANVSPSAPGDTVAAGASGKWADANHRHARESFGASGDITTSAPGDTASAGASGKVADAAHRHARESSVTVPAAYPKGVVYRSANITASQSASTQTDVTGMTAIAVTGDGVRRFRITAHIPSVTNAGTGQFFFILYEGATKIAQMGQFYGAAGGGDWSHDLIPAAGAHTYKIQVSSTAAGSWTINNVSDQPSWAMAEDIGNV